MKNIKTLLNQWERKNHSPIYFKWLTYIGTFDVELKGRLDQAGKRKKQSKNQKSDAVFKRLLSSD